ncbi:3-oxoadipyl-CoA thiolase [Histidinibacterium lentulum]|uniref:Beta-ketoadipyl-CoA thiolase n=1 Tax=Histidinibacterium lentulum TaxID=2480588 RepID=A0A3N2R5V9_9RHOB|nr:3-oxoadipyl-CoA thiolase [Histidinibacterium lentulum]ROU02788.1 3-oxoadipyl-CoA thiolase [Histidinibacterium lentulum]
MPDRPDAFICGYLRTPIGRYGGALASVRPDDLAAHLIASLLRQTPDLDPAQIDDVVLGNANQAGEDNRNVARMSLLLAGLPESVPGTTVNRLCASGLDAVLIAAHAIWAGEAELMLAGGVESMSRAPFVVPKAPSAYSRQAEIHDTTIGWRLMNPAIKAAHGTDSMPETAENVAETYAISRADQDAFALRSQEKTAAAMKSGRLRQEIVPVEVPQRKGDPLKVDRDEHPRETSLSALSALPTPFRKNGTVTAGNSSGVNDGAAVLIVASEEAARRHGLTPIARIAGGAAAGVAPRLMGIGPVPASRKLCHRLGRTPQDFDLVELNEAFASQALAVLRDLDIPADGEAVNPNGGAISLGHPLGMSGARLAGTAALELHHGRRRRALVTMCIGVGQGLAMALDAV